MRLTRGGVRRWLPAVAALSWAAFGLLWAQVLVLPHPLLPPPIFAELLGEVPATTSPQRFVVMIFKESSLLLCGFALVGLVLAALAWRSGAGRISLVAAGLSVATVVVSLAPVAQAMETASAEDVPLSLTGYFAGLYSVKDRFVDRPPETVTYAHPGGEELEADLWRPLGGGSAGEQGVAKRRPAVIVVHGGGWHSGGRGEFPLWNAWLAAKGYVVFDIDYRLSPPPNWREAPADVRCAVGWVKENAARYSVDPDRVVLMGRSAGGHLALLTAYTEDSTAVTPGCAARNVQDTGVAAVAAFYPPTDLARLSSLGYLGGIGDFLGGTQNTVPERYRFLSPVTRVDPGDPPTFLAYGGDDRIVPPGESERLAEQLQEASVPHRLVELPWANHTFDFIWGGWSSQITRSSLDAFLESSLQTPEDARTDPAGSCAEGQKQGECPSGITATSENTPRAKSGG